MSKNNENVNNKLFQLGPDDPTPNSEEYDQNNNEGEPEKSKCT